MRVKVRVATLAGGVSALTGAYSPSGAFSFQVYRRVPSGVLSAPLGEYFPLIGPERVAYGYRFAVSASPTFGGAAVSDLGNSMGTLAVSGQIHAFFEGTPSRPAFNPFSADSLLEGASLAGQTLLNSAFNAATVTAINAKTGVQDFSDLLWMFWHSRDNVRSRTRRPSSLPLLSDTHRLYLAMESGPLPFDFERFALIFNDYDSGKKLEIVVTQEGLNIEEDASDAFTWRYTLNFHVVKDFSGGAFSFRPPLPSIRTMVGEVRTGLDELALSVSSFLSGSAEIVRDLEDLRENRDFLKVTLDTFNEKSAADIQTLRRATGQGKSKSEKLREKIVAYYLAGEDASVFLEDDADYRDLAIDDTKRDIDKTLLLLNLLETGMVRAAGENRSGRSEYREPPPEARSWEELARHFFGDVSRANELRELNGVAAADSAPNELDKVAIPAPGGAGQQLVVDGIIHEPRLEYDAEDREIALYGTDLELAAGGDLAAAPNGDLGQVSGLATLIENSLDRSTNYQGTVPAHPDWGLPFAPGDLDAELLERIEPARVAENLMADPSVATATIVRAALREGAIEMTIRVRPTGSSREFTLDITKPRARGSA